MWVGDTMWGAEQIFRSGQVSPQGAMGARGCEEGRRGAPPPRTQVKPGQTLWEHMGVDLGPLYR